MAWQARRPVLKMRPPGYIDPVVAVLTERAPSGPRWIHEIKHDGYRLICRIDEAGIRCWSRHRTNHTGAFPRIEDALRQLPVSAALDGEVIVELPSGHHDFDALRTRDGQGRAIYLAFDLMMLAGNDLRATPLIERRAMLAELLAEAPPAIRYQDYLEGDGEEIFAQVCGLGLEGIVSKLKESRYASGRSSAWLKRKCPDYRRRTASR
jgi:bifunctional non-homologous end joining protein LigD